MKTLPRTVWLLSLCNAWLFIGNSMLITVSALIGFELAPHKELATLPLGLQFFAIMCTSVPASLFMERYGRKAGFLLAGVIGISGAGFALAAIFGDRFLFYCIATLCFGVFAGFGNYYRFTAAEVVSSDHRARAISLVMAGGVIAAFIGPNLANWSSNLFASRTFAGPFAVLIGVYLVSMATIALADLPRPPPRVGRYRGRAIGLIAAQPVFVVAVLCQMFGYATMNLVMTSTPLAMQVHGYGMSSMAFVIQWHVVAMFAPSFVTGGLITRFGIVPVLAAGVALCFTTVLINLSGESVGHFTIALALLGIGWNFLFVGGTTLLTDTYHPAEKARAQALNDLLVFGTVTMTALGAGTLHYLFGWRTVNLGVVPLLVAVACAITWLGRSSRVTQPRLGASSGD